MQRQAAMVKLFFLNTWHDDLRKAHLASHSCRSVHQVREVLPYLVDVSGKQLQSHPQAWRWIRGNEVRGRDNVGRANCPRGTLRRDLFLCFQPLQGKNIRAALRDVLRKAQPQLQSLYLVTWRGYVNVVNNDISISCYFLMVDAGLTSAIPPVHEAPLISFVEALYFMTRLKSLLLH